MQEVPSQVSLVMVARGWPICSVHDRIICDRQDNKKNRSNRIGTYKMVGIRTVMSTNKYKNGREKRRETYPLFQRNKHDR